MNNSKAIVASGHPEVSKAALEIIEAGGNAFDAVIGAGFAATVAEPALTSLGGGGFLLSRPKSGHSTLFDFFTECDARIHQFVAYSQYIIAPLDDGRPRLVDFPAHSRDACHCRCVGTHLSLGDFVRRLPNRRDPVDPPE